ncbi:MAG: tail-specific protease [Desulfuromonas sp.]|nr:MAG: tail-specific protease [Desulfuromonas sp.]
MLFRSLSARLVIAALLTTLLFGSGFASTATLKYNHDRARLLGYMIKESLPRNHYSHKEVADELSEAAFELYLKNLDSQKRFLLKPDLVVLNPYRQKIDDELKSGDIRFPLVTTEIIRDRIEATSKIVEDLLARYFDFTRKESIETDPDKLDFAATEAELKDRWRKILKYQVINRYLELEEEEKANVDNEESEVEARTETERKKEAREKIAKSYRDLFSRLLKNTEQDYFNSYIDAVSRAYDPHTNYMPPKDKEDFDIHMRGSLEGIGATLREEDGYIKVIRVIPGSAAARQGELESEDFILKVAQGADEPVDIVDMRLRDAVSLIRGKKGTEVRLTIKKPDARIVVIPIVRDVVQIEETFVKGTVLEKNNLKFGYIKIPSFYRDFTKGHGEKGRNVTDDVRAELDKFKQKKIDGLIIDLRNDGGGALTDAVKIAGFFIKEGPVVQVRDSAGDISTHADESGTTIYDGPMAVMVNQFSASSSEILAGVLQDYNRAVIIGGAHTHGKGTVQAILELDRRLPFRNMSQYKPLGALKVTIQKFYRVSGESTQYRGIIPDIILPDRLSHLKTGEQYSDYSLPWDTVKPVVYEKWGVSSPSIEKKLLELSQKRVAANEEFQRIMKNAARAKERSDKTERPLNIAAIRQQRNEINSMADDEEDSPVAPHGTGDDPEAWRESAAKDVYIGETQAILEDIITFPTDGLAKNTPRQSN